MVKITGGDRVANQFRRMAASRSLTDKALYVAGQTIEIDAEISITAGSISGAGHIPSAPGEPPNADSRLLDTSIHTVVVGPNRVNVESTAPYSAALEFGTSRISERPFMRPAAEKNRGKVQALIAEAVRRSTK